MGEKPSLWARLRRWRVRRNPERWKRPGPEKVIYYNDGERKAENILRLACKPGEPIDSNEWCGEWEEE